MKEEEGKRKEGKTIHQRAKEFVEEYNIPVDLQSKALSSIVELIERAKSPRMFCSECDSRMSIDFDTGILHCFNCNHKERFALSKETTIPQVESKEVEVKTDGRKPDKRLLNAIDTASKKPKLTKKAKSILNLANSRGGASSITKEDEDFVKKTVPGAKNNQINWS